MLTVFSRRVDLKPLKDIESFLIDCLIDSTNECARVNCYHAPRKNKEIYALGCSVKRICVHKRPTITVL
ncbi:Uncharacterized protein APZ42_010916 [Daphnia magna]|uniref:Uncharacterized protein n=1 Tax=Daphnia magna TaxID=35525 RepID=A0A0P5DJM3_9CRUS|nr:Uncharacterized protein APZ42_010916 [Daphnia magna]